jgi:hypothetical protein
MSDDRVERIGAQFGLRRDNFILDPISDYQCFARDDIDTRGIAEGLDVDVLTGLAPKRLVWGPYGGGKTHTLMRTADELSHLTPIHHVRVECPDLTKRSRFHDLYREGIMRALGQDFVVGLIEDVVRKVGFKRKEDLRAALKDEFVDEELAKAAERLYDPNFDSLKLWRWLAGVGVSRGELDQLGQTQDLTQAEAARLADILVQLARLLRVLRDTTLVLILDEMERLNAIGAETVTTFVSGFTRLVDPNQTSLCVLIGASAALESEMVEVFATAGPVTSRLGTDSLIEIPALEDNGVDRFIRGVIAYVRDSAVDPAPLVQHALQATGETFEASLFPFSLQAVDALKSTNRMLTPRAITIDMTRALGRAHRRKLPAITAACVS